jgi:uncharacterized protein
MSKVPAQIQAMVRRIVDQFQPEQVILFGSHARGEASVDSDVDFLVVLPVVGSKREAVLKIRIALHGSGVAKDIVVATPEEMWRYRDVPGTIIRAAALEGKVLYDRAA